MKSVTDDPREGTPVTEDPAKALRRGKRRATSLLLLAATIYVVMVAFGHEGWRGYVQATAEAAMIGAMADWFAVTALFRHPLGIPIPHTAIIPKRKDEIGESLGHFIQTNFLQAEILTKRIEEAHVSQRLGTWLEVPANAERAGDQVATILSALLDVLRDDEIQATLNATIRTRAETTNLGPILARIIDFAVEGGHYHALLDGSLRGVETVLEDNRDTMRHQFEKESPWWVPEQIDERVFLKIYSGIQTFLREINEDPNHEVRKQLDMRIMTAAQKFQESPELAARAEEIKHEILNHPDARAWIDDLWLGLKAEIRRAADTPESDLRIRIHNIVAAAGSSLRTDPELRTKVDQWLSTIAGQLAKESRTEVADLISSTVSAWDSTETSDMIELQIGRDLQFIRINGTLVGGLVGLVIHTLTQVFS